MFQNHHTVIAYLFPIVPELFPDMHRYEARKGDPQTCPEGDLMQMMSMKNITFTFLFRFPDQESCPGCFSHPKNFLSITFGLMRFFVHSIWTDYFHLTEKKV